MRKGCRYFSIQSVSSRFIYSWFRSNLVPVYHKDIILFSIFNIGLVLSWVSLSIFYWVFFALNKFLGKLKVSLNFSASSYVSFSLSTYLNTTSIFFWTLEISLLSLFVSINSVSLRNYEVSLNILFLSLRIRTFCAICMPLLRHKGCEL